MKALLQLVAKPPPLGHFLSPAVTWVTVTPTFAPFDSTSELWKDYWSQFLTFMGAHAVSDDRKAQVFLTNQSSTVYKLLSNLAAQGTLPMEINDLTMDQIVVYMKVQFHPTRFIIREHFKFWTNMQREPRESIQELAACIRQVAATCDFVSIAHPLDKALRTRFICSVNNEAVLKVLFKMKADELDSHTAFQVVIQTEDDAKVAKETVYGPKSVPALAIMQKASHQKTVFQRPPKKEVPVGQQHCYRCGYPGHIATSCKFKDAKYKFCKLARHLEAVCRKKAHSKAQGVKWIDVREMVKAAPCRNSEVPKLEVPIHLNGKAFTLELDTATGGNFKYGDVSKWYLVSFLVSKIPDQNLLGQDVIEAMRISWLTCCFTTLRWARRNTSCRQLIVLIASIDICNKRVAICATSSAIWSNQSRDVSVVCNSRLNSSQKRGPFSANHAPFHLPCRKNWRKPTMLELLEASGHLHLSMIGEPPLFQWEKRCSLRTNLLYTLAVTTL